MPNYARSRSRKAGRSNKSPNRLQTRKKQGKHRLAARSKTKAIRSKKKGTSARKQRYGTGNTQIRDGALSIALEHEFPNAARGRWAKLLAASKEVKETEQPNMDKFRCKEMDDELKNINIQVKYSDTEYSLHFRNKRQAFLSWFFVGFAHDYCKLATPDRETINKEKTKKDEINLLKYLINHEEVNPNLIVGEGQRLIHFAIGYLGFIGDDLALMLIENKKVQLVTDDFLGKLKDDLINDENISDPIRGSLNKTFTKIEEEIKKERAKQSHPEEEKTNLSVDNLSVTITNLKNNEPVNLIEMFQKYDTFEQKQKFLNKILKKIE